MEIPDIEVNFELLDLRELDQQIRRNIGRIERGQCPVEVGDAPTELAPQPDDAMQLVQLRIVKQRSVKVREPHVV